MSFAVNSNFVDIGARRVGYVVVNFQPLKLKFKSTFRQFECASS